MASKAISFQGETLSHELFTYNGFHLIAKTDAEGNTTTYEYDPQNQIYNRIDGLFPVLTIPLNISPQLGGLTCKYTLNTSQIDNILSDGAFGFQQLTPVLINVCFPICSTGIRVERFGQSLRVTLTDNPDPEVCVPDPFCVQCDNCSVAPAIWRIVCLDAATPDHVTAECAGGGLVCADVFAAGASWLLPVVINGCPFYSYSGIAYDGSLGPLCGQVGSWRWDFSFNLAAGDPSPNIGQISLIPTPNSLSLGASRFPLTTCIAFDCLAPMEFTLAWGCCCGGGRFRIEPA